METIHVSATVERDGELRIRSPELRAGQHVEAQLVIREVTGPTRSLLSLRGIFKGIWGSAEAIDRYLKDERDSWGK